MEAQATTTEAVAPKEEKEKPKKVLGKRSSRGESDFASFTKFVLTSMFSDRDDAAAATEPASPPTPRAPPMPLKVEKTEDGKAVVVTLGDSLILRMNLTEESCEQWSQRALWDTYFADCPKHFTQWFKEMDYIVNRMKVFTVEYFHDDIKQYIICDELVTDVKIELRREPEILVCTNEGRTYKATFGFTRLPNFYEVAESGGRAPLPVRRAFFEPDCRSRNKRNIIRLEGGAIANAV